MKKKKLFYSFNSKTLDLFYKYIKKNKEIISIMLKNSSFKNLKKTHYFRN